MHKRQAHQLEVYGFLGRHLGGASWTLALPGGSGGETYLARSAQGKYFIKLGVDLARYQAAASLGLTPPVLTTGHLQDGTSLLVQPQLEGRMPSWSDFCEHLDQFAESIGRLHRSPELQALLPPALSEDYQAAGQAWLAQIRKRWEGCRPQVPEVAGFVEQSLDQIAAQLETLQGGGLVASHNDPCNGNWLVAPDGRVYLLDLDSMSREDPAVDLGALLWWYYPPALRPLFLTKSGYANDEGLPNRMRIRMALHCLHISLPRPNSFDHFDPASFARDLVDFRAAFAGDENPRGYED
jgi:hypothetical protein